MTSIANLIIWLCSKTGHLIKAEWSDKSEGVYDHCKICGTLIKKEDVA
jgi:hypothetical protein